LPVCGLGDDALFNEQLCQRVGMSQVRKQPRRLRWATRRSAIRLL